MEQKLYFRRYRTTSDHFGWVLLRPDRWPSFVLSIRPQERRIVVRLLRSIFGLSWWPLRFWNKAALLAERQATIQA